MLIQLTLDPARLWRWHGVLVQALAAIPGQRVRVAFSAASETHPAALGLALQLEQAIGRRGEAHPFDPAAPADFTPWAQPGAPAGLVIDLAASAPELNPKVPTLMPLYNGAPGEAAFWSALLDGKAPALALHDSAGGQREIGQPAIESPHALRLSAAQVITRLMTGLTRAPAIAPSAHACSHPAPATPPSAAAPPATLGAAAAALMGRKLASKARRVLDRTLATSSQWSVAWRMRAAGFDPLAAAPLDLADFHLLPDDGRRYYADPFLFANDAFVDVFVEELPFATGRGIISMFTIRPDGSHSAPRTVLEAAHHLSYPQVFARDGAIWMLPEAHASGALTLYRAARYPDQWEAAARLIDEPLHDATLFEHGGRLWIAAATQGPPAARWGSSWDSLSLYWADRLLGPWTPHPANPVLIDSRSARPAGEVFSAGGALVRPVQDCSGGYGSRLGLARIDTLMPDAFAQTVVAQLAFSPALHMHGPHTLNRIAANGAVIEAIDLFAAPAMLAGAGKPARRTL